MNNTSSANVSIDVKPGLSLSALSGPEGIAWCTVSSLLSLFITVGNLLTIVLFAANKRVRKKSLYLVINMALADLLLGAFALPLYIYVSINNGYQFSLKIVNSTLARVYGLSYGISLWVSLTSAVSISCEKFYAVYWPFEHRTLTARTYHVALFVLWTLCLLKATAPFYLRSYNYFISHARSSYGVTAGSIICGSNIAIWRKFRHGNVTSQQKKRDEKNVRLTKTLMFSSILNSFCWVPLNIVLGALNESVSVPMRWVVIAMALNCCYAFINPVMYALRIPEFRQALALSCVTKR
ncbi:unnamed protein product, partial [Pocillopora meandrina]